MIPKAQTMRVLGGLVWLAIAVLVASPGAHAVELHWEPQPLPGDADDRNGAFVGMHNGHILVAGGMRHAVTDSGEQPAFLRSIWWADAETLEWQQAPQYLPSPRAFGATAAHANGIVLIGGSDGRRSYADVLLLRKISGESVELLPLVPLPRPAPRAVAAFVGDVLYVLVPGTSDRNASLYALDTAGLGNDPSRGASTFAWRELDAGPFANGGEAAQRKPILVSQDDGDRKTLFAIGAAGSAASAGRSAAFWQYRPGTDAGNWHRLSDIRIDNQPVPLGTGSAVAAGQSHLLTVAQSGTGLAALSYNIITGAWANYGAVAPSTPGSADVAVMLRDDRITVYAPGESGGALWEAGLGNTGSGFGWLNMTVLVVYLVAMVLVGVWFLSRNKDVNDYFRGGQSIPWWAAACSMYATMLSSLTYVGIPALAYGTNWVYWIGIWMILAVAPVAAWIAMPFFRQIDATSAYEYLSKRFNMAVRLVASGLFALFHIGRMGIVMALTALALAAVTPFDAWQCVLLIGVLSLIYCTLGGIEAVIWTDTIQTGVLLLGALLCITYIVGGVDGGIGGLLESGLADDKFRMINIDFSLDSFTTLSLWVIVLGGLGQNLSTYTADQAVVQRYMTTRDVDAARRSIWTNGLMAPLASALFFVIGTGLYVFYQDNPGKLDPTKQLDQVFPAFISTELPLGIAGLIIAGIFAAAQSTVSTSMNSIATTVVTDFIRPFAVCRSERTYLSIARIMTLLVGALGTLTGLLFISPEIRSLMEEYFKVVGMFMGALGGLFVLGVVSTRANAPGAITGLFVGVGVMLLAWSLELTNGYLFGTIGIATCLLVGYIASRLIRSADRRDLGGLTLHTMQRVA